ncbi:putative odorant receptor 83c [Topomyia yanbarensis]|uniref:putative odorant receptor 83c n=1 Tax=Topomyia yanbarensis TaxID=2498891 RepID=UPI00273BD579|nr:putative odorant receptor 83c [Topomyia yanbarensis]
MADVEAFYSIRAPLITLSKIIGVGVWNRERTLTPASYYLMANMVAYNVCTGYTILKHASDPIELMQCTIIFGVASLLIFKFFISIYKKKVMSNLFDLTEENVYRRYSVGIPEEKAIVAKTSRYLSIVWKLMSALYFSTLFVFSTWPIYVYYTENRLVPLFSYEIPMVDTNQAIGYGLTMLFHVNIYLLGVFGAIISDYMFVFLAFHALACTDLFILHLAQLETLLNADSHEKDNSKIAENWLLCMQDHQFATEFYNTTEDIFSFICMVQVFTCVYTICDAMLLITLNDWYAAYCFLLVVFGNMAIYFILGNFVELKLDEMYDSITALSWNLLTLSQQKEYHYMLARSQRPMMLTIFGFVPMNFESYMSVLRMLYQFFVMVMQYMS